MPRCSVGRIGRRILVIVPRLRELLRALFEESYSLDVVWPLLPGRVTMYIRSLIVSVDVSFAQLVCSCVARAPIVVSHISSFVLVAAAADVIEVFLDPTRGRWRVRPIASA